MLASRLPQALLTVLTTNFKVHDSLLDFRIKSPATHFPYNPATLLFSLLLSPGFHAVSRYLAVSTSLSWCSPVSHRYCWPLTRLLFRSALDSCVCLWIYSLFHSQQPYPFNRSTEQPFRWFLSYTSSYTYVTIYQHVLQSPPPEFPELFKTTLVTGIQIFNMESVRDNSHSNHSKTKLTDETWGI